jgi:exodeoxyribonuclease V alpha subunit
LELTGEITSIIYQNEVNSYTIAEMYVDEIDGKEDNLITIVGYLPFVVEGDELKIVGRFVEHKEYGRQFKVDTFEKLMPQTLEALERYLGNGMIKGVGPATARKIINTFQEDTINVIKLQPLKLSQIKGITKEKALEISESFIEHWEVWQIVGFLERFGIGAENSKRVYDELGINAIEQIEANPYILIDIARGVDFKQVDKMAMDLGMEQNNDKRVKSAIKYALIRITYNGHCCTLEENLIEYVRSLLEISVEDIENSYINLKATGEIVEEERENGETWVYLANFFNTENSIANKIIDLDNAKNLKYVKNIKKELGKIEIIDDIELSEKQKEAIEAVNDNNVSIITGGPGTGKTTIIKSIIEIYQAKGKKVVLCAPTGRAAKRITETTGEDASTLHRLLEIGKFDDDIFLKKQKEYQGTPIDADVVIVDEVSMVDMFLMNYLVSSLYKGTKLVLVGDSDQLPSVGPGSVLKDLIESEVVTTIHLDKVFRQAAKSQIVVNAHRVNEGEYFLPKEDLEEDSKQDFFVINEANPEKVLYQVLSLCTGRLQNYGDYDFFKNIQILTPTKKGMLGTKELNSYLQNFLNPEDKLKREKKANGAIYRVGDRIMQIKNNYDIYWEKQITDTSGKVASNSSLTRIDKSIIRPTNIETGTGIFNGELGRITFIDNDAHQLEVEFDDGKTAMYAFSELEELEHSYSITIHKAQGSEFDVVILVVPQTSNMLLTRNLLYTGMTRAKKLLIVIGNNNLINNMIQNSENKKRNTGLKTKLIS